MALIVPTLKGLACIDPIQIYTEVSAEHVALHSTIQLQSDATCLQHTETKPKKEISKQITYFEFQSHSLFYEETDSIERLTAKLLTVGH